LRDGKGSNGCSRKSRFQQPGGAGGELRSEHAENIAEVEGFKVALVRDSGPHESKEVQTLLRKRLRILCLIALFVGLVYFAIHLPSRLQRGAFFDVVWFEWVCIGLYLTVVCAVTGVLWSSRPLAIGHLRIVELLLFGGTLLAYAGYIYIPLQSGALENYARLGEAGGWAVGSAVSLPAFATTVGYGLFIPNTWSRCAAVVAVMALLPLSVSALAMGLAEQQINESLRFAYFREMGVWMTIGAIFAIFGSHRINILQRQAFETRKLGQYRLKESLGVGGMGEVYLAEHALLRRPCAIKLIRPERAGDPQTLRRFEREVQATASLTHPNTVEIFDYGHADDGTFYYVMEYLPGFDLERMVQDHGPLPPERAIHFMRQVCGSLGEAHSIGLIHRDLKPSNIFICERGGQYDVAKLLDFGLVQTSQLDADAGKLTLDGSVTGTPAYMSPEQAAGQDDVDARSDIYSLGAVMYFLLTGQPPFQRQKAIQMIVAHLHDPIVPPAGLRPEIPSDLEEVVLRCLAKEPDQRYADIEAAEEALACCECADRWSAEQAANWWRDRERDSVAMPFAEA
jgi:serine/threonine-protein kinase